MVIWLLGYESCSVTFRKKCRLRVFGKRVLRRILGPKRAEVTVGLRKLWDRELHNLHASADVRVI